MYILYANSQSPEETIVVVAAQVEVVISNPTAMCTIKAVGASLAPIEVVIIGIEQEHISIHIIGLIKAIRTIVALPAHYFALLILVEFVILGTLIVGQSILRATTQRVGSRQNLVEVLTLVVVKAHINE